MLSTRVKYGIPDVELRWSCGGSVNPSCFAGHQLVVLFLPKDARLQSAELQSYDQLASELSGSDAWFIVVDDETCAQSNAETRIALDREGKAWQAFQDVAGKGELDRADGATFFFTRGGTFHRAWRGPGHAAEVLEELLTRG